MFSKKFKKVPLFVESYQVEQKMPKFFRPCASGTRRLQRHHECNSLPMHTSKTDTTMGHRSYQALPSPLMLAPKSHHQL